MTREDILSHISDYHNAKGDSRGFVAIMSIIMNRFHAQTMQAMADPSTLARDSESICDDTKYLVEQLVGHNPNPEPRDGHD